MEDDMKSLDDLEDSGKVVNFFNSEEFRKGFSDLVKANTWGKGQPMIIGERGTNNVWAVYEDGERVLLSYQVDDIVIKPPNKWNGEEKYSGHYKDYYLYKLSADSEAELIQLLKHDRKKAIDRHSEMYLKMSEESDDFF